jgi:soluble lytic murein transglycosylase
VASKTVRRLVAVGGLALALGCRRDDLQTRPPVASSPSVALARLPAPDPGGDDGDAKDAMPKLTVVLEDPRLASVRDRLDRADVQGAAQAMVAARAGATLDAAGRCAWDYVVGKLDFEADDLAGAAAAFEADRSNDRDAGMRCPLASIATLREAEVLVRAGDFDRALACVREIDEPLASQDEARLAMADALAGKGDRASAIAVWRSLLAARPHGLRWVDTSLRLARALLDGVDGPPGPSGGQEALDLTTRVTVEAPAAAEKLDAQDLRHEASRLLGGREPPLTIDQRVRQARAWLDSDKPEKARDVAQDLLHSIPKSDKRSAPAACDAAVLLAETSPRGKPDRAADAWGTAIARCAGLDPLVTALYQGAKSSQNAKRRQEALDRFGRVESMFPDHRLADDARLRAASIVEETGDRTRALAMLSSLPEVYPQGDMRGEALFRVALDLLVNGDTSGARDAFEKMSPSSLETPGSVVAGRAEYFAGRAAQLSGDVETAKSRYEHVIATAPLSYFMLFSYARLRALDEAAARSTLQAAVEREPGGSFLTSDHPELFSPSFQRTQRLLEVGEFDAARREVAAGGLTDEGADPEVLWAIAWQYDRAGAPDLGQGLVRGRLVDYRSHWPVGRWRIPWEIAFPRPWAPAVAREAASAGVPSSLVWAVMREESAFNPEARSHASALGLMQLMSSTARRVARDASLPWDDDALRTPAVSIALGARLLGALRVSFPERPELAVAAYNGGEMAVRRWLATHGEDDPDVFTERIGFDETRAYVRRVLASEAAYAYLYDPATLDELLGK